MRKVWITEDAEAFARKRVEHLDRFRPGVEIQSVATKPTGSGSSQLELTTIVPGHEHLELTAFAWVRMLDLQLRQRFSGHFVLLARYP